MRYFINFDKTINQLVPHYLGGRKLVLYLQALMKPLQVLNETFVAYAKETRIEASMTSQKIMFEWYLNRKFGKYLLGSGKITLSNGQPIGTPTYYEDADGVQSDNMVLYNAEEGAQGTVLYRSNEQTDASSHSFIVTSPAIDTSHISLDNYKAMLAHYIDKYRLSGKTYIIKTTHNERI